MPTKRTARRALRIRPQVNLQAEPAPPTTEHLINALAAVFARPVAERLAAAISEFVHASAAPMITEAIRAAKAQPDAIELEPNRLLDIHQTARLLGSSPRTVRKMTAEGEFPAPVRLGSRVFWRARDCQEWINGLPHEPGVQH